MAAEELVTLLGVEVETLLDPALAEAPNPAKPEPKSLTRKRSRTESAYLPENLHHLCKDFVG